MYKSHKKRKNLEAKFKLEFIKNYNMKFYFFLNISKIKFKFLNKLEGFFFVILILLHRYYLHMNYFK